MGCMKGIKIHHIFTWQPCKEFQTSDVRWVVDQIDIIQEVEQYYNSLFSTSNPTDLNCILNHIKMIVSDSINQDLINEVDDEEIKNVVFAMRPLKAPGLQNDDGRASIDIVALDSFGNLLHAHGAPIQFVGEVMTAEAIAIRKALEYAITKGWKRVKILSDAKNVVYMIQK
ncbi:uncharacterized protein LOC107009571 isoform X2 [Solanum pennellii]|uniref:Uncharacterized protein LOC107009571 isoform X2 n=1 Tax=Solanum pennellii TaxID=28526 RepID=A0ABM1V3X5_SOLPN|nr:uncharacterized protein LOC107009571 isoform X2 [Solanum pennellii]